jgi:muramoyltetrapeptide carboxypeptidase
MMILKPGDGCSIVAPASQLRGGDQGLLPAAVVLLESWGLRVRVRTDKAHHFYLAGTDPARADQLNAALADPDTKVIFCTRGGYGSPRLLPYLKRETLPPPKILVGYSDITALHLAVRRLWPQIDVIHGPNVATHQLLGPEAECDLTRQSLHEALFSANRVLVEQLEFLRPGSAQGRLEGGCLSLVVSTLGTAYASRTRGAIVFLEDTGEAPYRIDRMLTQLGNAGKLDEVRGVVFGVMRNCKDPNNDLREVLKDFFRESAFPVAFGLRSGHGEVNLSLRLGARAELDSERSWFRMGTGTNRTRSLVF